MGNTIQVLETRNKGSFKVYIPGDNAEQAQIKITDIAGRMIQEFTADLGRQIELTLNDQGLYIVNIATASEIFTKRIKVD